MNNSCKYYCDRTLGWMLNNKLIVFLSLFSFSLFISTCVLASQKNGFARELDECHKELITTEAPEQTSEASTPSTEASSLSTEEPTTTSETSTVTTTTTKEETTSSTETTPSPETTPPSPDETTPAGQTTTAAKEEEKPDSGAGENKIADLEVST